jgi:renalase
MVKNHGSLNVAIIGAGLTGLILAHRINQFAKVSVFEKSRGLGGRTATRYTDKFQFDHGAPYFTAEHPDFLDYLSTFKDQGLIKSWMARCIQYDQGVIKNRWQESVMVSCPQMNSWAKYLAQDLAVQRNTRIEMLKFQANQWQLVDQNQVTHGPFDLVISTCPWPQAQALFGDFFQFDFPEMQSRMVYLLGYDKPLNLDWDIAFFQNQDLDRIVVNSAKPERRQKTSVLVYTHQQHGEEDSISGLVEAYLPAEISYQDQHYWRYALSGAKQDYPIICSKDLRCMIAGDWLRMEPGVEASYMVAQELWSWFGDVFLV